MPSAAVEQSKTMGLLDRVEALERDSSTQYGRG